MLSLVAITSGMTSNGQAACLVVTSTVLYSGTCDVCIYIIMPVGVSVLCVYICGHIGTCIFAHYLFMLYMYTFCVRNAACLCSVFCVSELEVVVSFGIPSRLGYRLLKVERKHGAFPKLGVPFLGVPRIRIIVFWGLSADNQFLLGVATHIKTMIELYRTIATGDVRDGMARIMK